MSVTWRFELCDLSGTALAIIDSVMANGSLTFQLNRPALLSFDVPADNEFFNTIWNGDGWNEPYLTTGIRIIKGYRRDGTYPTQWTLRFVGRVWTIEDSGDGDTVRSSVTVYDFLYDLNARMVRGDATHPNGHSTDPWGFSGTVKFFGLEYGTVIKTMIDRTNAHAKSPTRIETTGTWATTAACAVTYDQQKILPSMIKLTDTGLVDLVVDYVDPGTGIYMKLGCTPELGMEQDGVILGYAGPPRVSSTMTRTESMDTFANDITIQGKTVKGNNLHAPRDYSSTSIAKYDVFEDYIVESSVESKPFLVDLVHEQLALRKKPRELINILPMPNLAPTPWDDWFLGDQIWAVIGTAKNPIARKTTYGLQRIYGFTIGMEENYTEHITNMVMSPDAESST